ncbi:MAG: hypothetical protein ACO2XQ_03660, partial [Flavobacteriales bacterium]
NHFKSGELLPHLFTLTCAAGAIGGINFCSTFCQTINCLPSFREVWRSVLSGLSSPRMER